MRPVCSRPRQLRPCRAGWQVIVCGLLGGWFALSPAEPLFGPDTVGSVTIQVTDSIGRTRWRTIARSCIALRPGKPHDPVLLEQSLDALNGCNRFASVELDSLRQDGRIDYTFRLQPAYRVRRIRVHGEFPLFQSDITKVLSLRPGTACNPGDVVEQNALIADLYEREGFGTPQIRIVNSANPGGGFCDLSLLITRGPYARLRHWYIDGNQYLSDFRIQLWSRSWRRNIYPGPAGRYVNATMEQDVSGLLAHYRRLRFAECRIAHAIEVDTLHRAVSVRMNIDEGPRYRVSFKGNRRERDRRLRRKLTIFTEGNRNNTGVRKSLRALQDYYANRGFLNPQFQVRDTVLTDAAVPLRRLDFIVDEGRRVRVAGVDFSGQQAVPAPAIRSRISAGSGRLLRRAYYDPLRVDQDCREIAVLYRNRGFDDVQVVPQVYWENDSTRVRIHFHITEGPTFQVRSVAFQGLEGISEEEVRRRCVSVAGAPLVRTQVSRDEAALSRFIASRGFPHVKVSSAITRDSLSGDATVSFDVVQGKLVRVGHQFVTGNFTTSRRYLLREMKLRRGDPFSLVRFLEGQRELRNLDIIDGARFSTVGLREQHDSVHVFVDVEERKPFYVELSGGYNSTTRWTGSGTVGTRNFLGLNKNIYLKGALAQVEKSTALGLVEPRLLGKHTSASIEGFYKQVAELNMDYAYHGFGALTGLKRTVSRELAMQLAVNLERRIFFDTPLELAPRTTVLVIPSVRLDRRDVAMRPRKGGVASFSCDIAQGVGNDVDNFARFHANGSFFLSTPSQKVTLAMRGQAWYIKPFSEDSLPADRLMYLGGSTTVRGFGENLLEYTVNAAGQKVPTGNTSAVIANAELRFDLRSELETVIFYDTGLLSDMRLSGRFLSSAGGGLRYHTPIGPIGAVLAARINPRRHEPPVRLHFSIGYMF